MITTMSPLNMLHLLNTERMKMTGNLLLAKIIQLIKRVKLAERKLTYE